MSWERGGSAGRGLTGLLLALALTGCPSEHEPVACEPTESEIAGELNDPLLGVFRGSLTWLQTGEETDFDVRARPNVATAADCGYREVNVTYSLESGDGVLRLEEVESVQVDSEGFIVPGTLTFEVDAHLLIEAGKLAEASNLGDRDPSGALSLGLSDAGGYSGSLVVTSSMDRLNVALVETMPEAP